MTDPTALHTRLCDRIGIATPILNAPMGGGDAPGELAAAVSRAGGLGMIGGTTAGETTWLVEQIHRARDLTDRPFGVGLLSHRPNCERLMHAALEEGVKVIAHSFADPTPFVPAAHDAGALVLCQVRTVAAAVQAAEAGVDVVTAQGTEAGGHTGHVATLALVPAVVDAVAPLPVVAAGGIADGRTIAAALVLGADAVWIGTRFLATWESGVSDAHKEAVIGASADDTVLTDVYDIDARSDWPADVSGRAIRDEFADRWHTRERELQELVDRAAPEPPTAGTRAPGARAFWAGEASGFVTRREAAADVVASLTRDAEAVLATRTAALLGRGSAATSG